MTNTPEDSHFTDETSLESNPAIYTDPILGGTTAPTNVNSTDQVNITRNYSTNNNEPNTSQPFWHSDSSSYYPQQPGQYQQPDPHYYPQQPGQYQQPDPHYYPQQPGQYQQPDPYHYQYVTELTPVYDMALLRTTLYDSGTKTAEITDKITYYIRKFTQNISLYSIIIAQLSVRFIRSCYTLIKKFLSTTFKGFTLKITLWQFKRAITPLKSWIKDYERTQVKPEWIAKAIQLSFSYLKLNPPLQPITLKISDSYDANLESYHIVIKPLIKKGEPITIPLIENTLATSAVTWLRIATGYYSIRYCEQLDIITSGGDAVPLLWDYFPLFVPPEWPLQKASPAYQ